jgi:1,4-alpha-glucan branching enzyme
MKPTRVKRPASRSSGNRKVRFVLPFIEAREVYLSGSFNDWNPTAAPMAEAPEGWALELELPAGAHEYLFVADGRWVADPNNPVSRPNPFGGVNSLIEVMPEAAAAPRSRAAGTKPKSRAS